MVEILSFYYFKNLNEDRLTALETDLGRFESSIRGLMLIGHEGINATVSGPALSEFRSAMETFFQAPIDFKASRADRHPFREFKIERRNEIVTLGRPDLVPNGSCGHLSPAEWQAALRDPDAIVLDTRNSYEIEIGKFKGAVSFNMREFREFPEHVQRAKWPKDKKILMYCTGGIRCEKAALEMREQGFESVMQLQGGILEYIKEFPEQNFEGECFVFDYRVAVDQRLQPSERFRFCPHCGQPGDQKIDCRQCGTSSIVCATCLEKSENLKTCSKNCAHHAEIGSSSRKPHRQEQQKRQTT